MLPTISRYILSDLLRTITLTASILVTVIAFGATIKPLADDALLNAAQAAKYLVLAMVPMLQFALPFAAGFGSTMVLHRMAAQNEISAMAVGGISYRRILFPVFVLATVLLVIMLGLTQYVIPRFWGLLRQTVATDVTKLFQSSIERGMPFEIGSLQIHADSLLQVDEGPQPNATRMVLYKVAAAELLPTGQIARDITAQQAVVDIYRVEGRTKIMLAMQNAVVFSKGGQELYELPQYRLPEPYDVASALSDSTMTRTLTELLQMRTDFDDYGGIAESRQMLAEVLRDHEIWSMFSGRLAAQGFIRFSQPGPGDRSYEVRADTLEAGRFRSADGMPVKVTQYEDGNATRSFEVSELVIRRQPGSALRQSAFDLALNDYTVRELSSGGATNTRAKLDIRGLTFGELQSADRSEMSSATLLAEAEAIQHLDPRIGEAVALLRRDLDRLQSEITGRIHQRFALAATGFLLVLLGGIMAMWLRDSLPLTIYLWAFAPAVLDLIVISGGEQMVRDGSRNGLVVLWLGNILLGALSIFAYNRLARH